MNGPLRHNTVIITALNIKYVYIRRRNRNREDKTIPRSLFIGAHVQECKVQLRSFEWCWRFPAAVPCCIQEQVQECGDLWS